jgi:3-hydroxy-5-methyl-1-naphthoate 3-O-methyltransferase
MKDGSQSPMALADLANGWWKFKTLASALEIGLFEQLSRHGGLTTSEFAHTNNLGVRPADMLLTACASLGLLGKAGERYFNAPVSEEFLIPGKRFYFGAWIELCDQRVEGWTNLTDGLRQNRPTTWDPDSGNSLMNTNADEMFRLFWEGMHSLSAYSAYQFAKTVDLSGVRHLLDLGGCSGTYSVELCRHNPRLNATVYDLPFILKTARNRISAEGMDQRITTVEGDFFKDPALPQGYDAMLLSMILHDWDEESNRTLLSRCFDALPSGGLLFILELLVNDEKTGPSDAALMSLNMLVETLGRNYTEREYLSWLTDVGLIHMRTVPIESPGANAVIIVTKP